MPYAREEPPPDPEPSPGEVITGRDRHGALHSGTVIEIIGTEGGTAYRLNTHEFYGSGKPVEPVVTYLFHSEGYDLDSSSLRVGLVCP